MRLSTAQIKAMTQGTESIVETENGIEFRRFTALEAEAFHTTEARFAKTFATAGVRMEFETDANTLWLKVGVAIASSRSYFAIDVLVNEKRTDSLRNSPEDELLGSDYAKKPCFWEGMAFEKCFSLGTGKKKVSVHFPWSFSVILEEMTLEGATYVKPLPRPKKVLMLGDSITHGYDALCPSRSYASRLSSRLNAEEFNKAIGGERFYPTLAERLVKRDYDLITVAYGTNDWHCESMDEARDLCEGFFRTLCEKFSETQIFVISPIWRLGCEEHMTAVGAFTDMEKMIFEVADKYKNTIPIQGLDLVPHDSRLYGDLYLHPNDLGFAEYAENLYRKMQAFL